MHIHRGVQVYCCTKIEMLAHLAAELLERLHAIYSMHIPIRYVLYTHTVFYNKQQPPTCIANSAYNTHGECCMGVGISGLSVFAAL